MFLWISMVFKLGACCVIKFSEDERTHGEQNGFVYSTKTELYVKKENLIDSYVRLFYDVCLWLGKGGEFGKGMFCPKSWQAYSYARNAVLSTFHFSEFCRQQKILICVCGHLFCCDNVDSSHKYEVRGLQIRYCSYFTCIYWKVKRILSMHSEKKKTQFSRNAALIFHSLMWVLH